jgi:hypothetical protein
VLEAVEVGQRAPEAVLVDKVVALRRDLAGRTFAIWGLAFKPNTDDMREAPSRVIVAELLRRGARVRAFDPVAADEARAKQCLNHFSPGRPADGAHTDLGGLTIILPLRLSDPAGRALAQASTSEINPWRPRTYCCAGEPDLPANVEASMPMSYAAAETCS